MAIIKTHTASAQNSYSAKFALDARPVKISFTGTSAVEIKSYSPVDGTTLLGTLEVENPISEFSPVVKGLFTVGVPTGGFVDETVITVEQ